MKNIVYIDIDTERKEQPVRIGKPSDFIVPETQDKDIEVTTLDLKSLVEGVLVLGIYMDGKEYQAFEDTLDEVVSQLKDGWEDYEESNQTDDVE